MKPPYYYAHSIFMIIPFLCTIIPLMIVNYIMAKRKGKNPIAYCLLSILPFVGFPLCIYLLSLIDKDIEDKINKIYEKLGSGQ